jgi:hypothetical protein
MTRYFSFLFFNASYAAGVFAGDQERQIAIRRAMYQHLARELPTLAPSVMSLLCVYESAIDHPASAADAGGSTALAFAISVLPGRDRSTIQKCARLAVEDHVAMMVPISKMFEKVTLTN